MHAALALLLLGLTLLTSLAAADDPDGVWGWAKFDEAKGYVSTTFPVMDGASVYAYIDEDYHAHRIERAVIQLHGHGRDCWNYARHTSDARQEAVSTMGLDARSVLSIAPELLGVGDLHSGAFASTDGYLCWLGDDWSAGADNVAECTPGVSGVSAFTAIDAIIDWLQNKTRFPSLDTIVVSGHSLGGQFVQRYASLGSGRNVDGVDVLYWVGNSASYLYLNDARPATKAAIGDCPEYDEYKYGLQQLGSQQSYASPAPSASQIWATYAANNVHLALGLSDSGSGNLGCEGLLQGESHLDRGLGYMNFVQRWAGGLPDKHTVDFFAGITHNAGNMLQQPTSLQRLFADRADSVTPSHAPDGMTNGIQLRFHSLLELALLDPFNDTQAITPLPSRVGAREGQNTAGSNTASAPPLSPTQKQSNLHRNGAMPTSPALSLVLALLVAVVSMASLGA